jgi:hypothetical protein
MFLHVKYKVLATLVDPLAQAGKFQFRKAIWRLQWLYACTVRSSSFA